MSKRGLITWTPFNKLLQVSALFCINFGTYRKKIPFLHMSKNRPVFALCIQSKLFPFICVSAI